MPQMFQNIFLWYKSLNMNCINYLVTWKKAFKARIYLTMGKIPITLLAASILLV